MTEPNDAAPAAQPKAAPADGGPMNFDQFAAMFATEPAEGAGENAAQADAATPAEGAADAEETPEGDSAAEEAGAADTDEDIEIPEDGEDGAADLPAVEMPPSWPAEFKPAFAKLAPEAQRDIAAWQAKRDRETDAKLNEAHVKARAKFEGEELPQVRQAIGQKLAQLDAALQHYADPTITAFRAEFADIIDGKITPLQLQDPDAGYRYDANGRDRLERFNAYQAQFAQVDRAWQQIAAEQEAVRKAEFEKFRTAETAKYREKHQLTDDAAWKEHDADLTDFAEANGFTADQLAFADSRHMNVLRAAMMGQQAAEAEQDFAAYVRQAGLEDGLKDKDGNAIGMPEAARRYARAVAAKRQAEANPQARPVPKVARPGVSQPQPGALERKRAAFNEATSKPLSVDAFADALREAM